MDNIFAAVVDMETTGLSAQFDVPLEIGVMLIDKEGTEIDSVSSLVWEMNDEFQNAVGAANSFVQEMHTKSGLWDDLNSLNHAQLAARSRVTVDEFLVQWLSAHNVERGAVPMLGNSIGSLDRPFALQHFPRFNEFLSYRNIDISSIKEICKAHNPKLFKALEPIIGTKADADHRVLSDIKACIREYQAYIDNFFFIED